MTTYRFSGVIQAGNRGGAWVDIPFDVEKTFRKKRVPIRATIDGLPYRGSLVRMGGDCHMLLILKAIREKIGKEAGDKVSVALSQDTAPRKVEPRADVKKALRADRRATAFFVQLAYTHQREYLQWIEGARQIETRRRRIAQMLELLKQGKKER